MADTDHEILSEGFIEGFERRYPTHVLETLLCDRTTGKNIIWADNEYEALGDGYLGDDEITVDKICGLASGVIKPRIAKEAERQSQRTKSRAEVFTPSWLCNQMNNDIDAVWFGRRDAFNTETVGDDGARGWTAVPEPVTFPKAKGHGWHAYVEATRLEITCGEAPFVCSRYDTVTGLALPVAERVGFLDRKLRVVTEKTKTRKEWVKWALAALRATYAFEYQGDNLLLARINVLETFAEHLRERWGEAPTPEEAEAAAWVVSWNLWQMNGFTDAVPTNKMGAEVESTLGTYEQPAPEPIQPTLFDLFDGGFGDGQEETPEEPRETVPLCVIYDWKADEPFEFASMKGKATAMGKKFYAVIGNPPYQEDSGDTSDKPIYDSFMDEAYKVGEKVELITPARFLFVAGKAPKAWSRKMLQDEHLAVLDYTPVAADVFPSVGFKGGVAITLRDSTKKLGPIVNFIPNQTLRGILTKVVHSVHFEALSSCVNPTEYFNISQTLYEVKPEILTTMIVVKGREVPLVSKGHESDLTTNILDKNPTLFTEVKPNDGNDYKRIYGRQNGRRVLRFFRSDFLTPCEGLEKYKVIVAESNGAGSFGEVLVEPVVGDRDVATTQTFITIGFFDARNEADAALKYIKSKFARAMLDTLKVTQHNKRDTWDNVPLQDFTSTSDIDWSKSIPEIDQQLYAKYGLDEDEIEFIESHVKEMD